MCVFDIRQKLLNITFLTYGNNIYVSTSLYMIIETQKNIAPTTIAVKKRDLLS